MRAVQLNILKYLKLFGDLTLEQVSRVKFLCATLVKPQIDNQTLYCICLESYFPWKLYLTYHIPRNVMAFGMLMFKGSPVYFL